MKTRSRRRELGAATLVALAGLGFLFSAVAAGCGSAGDGSPTAAASSSAGASTSSAVVPQTVVD